MVDSFTPSHQQLQQIIQQKDKSIFFNEKQYTPKSTEMSPSSIKNLNNTLRKYSFQNDKQKQNSQISQSKDEVLETEFSKISSNSQRINSFLKVNPHQRQPKYDQSIFDKLQQELDEKEKREMKSTTTSLSIQKYTELISNTSPTQIHLPAQRIKQSNNISEHSSQNFNETIKDGFTSFYSIKANNQDYLINLHNKRQSISNIVDLGELEMNRQIAKKNEQKQDSIKAKNKKEKNNLTVQFQYNNKDQIQLELEHNKAMYKTFSKNNQHKLLRMFKDVHTTQCYSEQRLSQMPPIRKYPAQMRKEPQNISIQKEEIELDEKLQHQKKAEEVIKGKELRHKTYFYTIQQNDWKPCAREGASLVVDKNKAYLFGGVGQNIFNTVETLDLGYLKIVQQAIKDSNLKWQVFEHVSAKNNIPESRFGHTMNYHKGQLILFGGETHFNVNFKQRQLLMDLYFLNIEQKKWTLVNVSGEQPCGRRCHTASIVGRWLVVHGGSNFRETILSDLWAFDTGTQSWQELSTVCQDPQKNKFIASGHTSSSIFYPSRQNKLILFKYTDVKVPKWMPQIAYEGIYYFGGKDEEGKASNSLRILKIDSNPLQWIIPQIFGKSPCPRYGHTMNLNLFLNLLVICGGKNDEELYLNDLHLLHLENLQWLSVETNGTTPLARANHSAVCYDSKLIIFGGLNQEGYLTSQLQMIELDENLSKQMIQKDVQKRNQMVDENKRIQRQREQRDQLSLDRVKKMKYSRYGDTRKSVDMDIYQTNNNNNNNYEYGDIPFSTKQISGEQDEMSYETKQIEKLNFNNFVSFLPIPKQTTYSKGLQHQRTISNFIGKKTQRFPELSQFSGSNNSSPSVSQSKLAFQKTVNKLTAISNVLQSFKHS